MKNNLKYNKNMENKEYAGFWIRVVATVIDNIILGAIFGVILGSVKILILFYGIVGHLAIFIVFIIFIILNLFFPIVATVFFWRKFKATPGKMFCKLKVVDAKTGENLSVGKAIGRYLGYILSGLFFGLGFIWIAFDSKKQGWHDKLASTVVIKANVKTEKVFLKNKK